MLKKGSKPADLISPGWAAKVRMLSGDFLEEVIVELKDEQGFNRDARWGEGEVRGGSGGIRSRGGCSKQLGQFVQRQQMEKTQANGHMKASLIKPDLKIHWKAMPRGCPNGTFLTPTPLSPTCPWNVPPSTVASSTSTSGPLISIGNSSPRVHRKVRPGKLGDQLFQFAWIISVPRKLGELATYESWHETHITSLIKGNLENNTIDTFKVLLQPVSGIPVPEPFPYHLEEPSRMPSLPEVHTQGNTARSEEASNTSRQKHPRSDPNLTEPQPVRSLFASTPVLLWCRPEPAQQKETFPNSK